ncbi:MAG: Gfo/Idh/MocA family oxidoreductase, partial [Pseudomonadota bacterium]
KGYQRPPTLDFFMTRYTAAYANEIAAFVQALADGATPPTTGEDGLRALAMAEASLLSIKEKREVRLDEIL